MATTKDDTFHGALERLDAALMDLKWSLRVAWHDTLERILWWLAFHTPHRLCAYIHARMVGHATTGRWSRTNVPGIPAMEVAKRWDLTKDGPVEAPLGREWLACSTGDCPHMSQVECDAWLAGYDAGRADG